MGYILAGTYLVRALNQNTGAQIFRSKTTQENTLGFNVTEEEVRGGLSNQKIGSYFHDSILNATITEALFSLEYLAVNMGGIITVGSDTFAEETVTTTVANAITVKGTPVNFLGLGIIGRYTIAGTEDWKPLTFVGKTAQVAGLPLGTSVCVEYTATNSTARSFTVSSAFIPDEVILVMEVPLFKANEKSFVQSSQVGKLVITIPRFLFSGNQDLTITSSGVSTTNLSGSALASFSGTNCSNLGQYATIEQILFNQTPEDGLGSIAIYNADIALKAGESYPLEVLGIYESNRVGNFPSENLTFLSGTTATATISNDGILTAVAVGTSDITVTVTSVPMIEAYGKVTVTA